MVDVSLKCYYEISKWGVCEDFKLALMKSKLDLVSMFPVSVNGRSPVSNIKRRKAREGFAGVRPVENTPMLKSYYKFSKEFLTILSQCFMCPYLSSYPSYSLLQVGAVISVNTVLSVFLLRGTWH